MINKYLKRSHISERKFKEILRYFSFDIDAQTTSKLTSIWQNSINKIFKYIRIRISEYCYENSIFASGEIELDESYFGASRVKDKIPAFGILKRGDKVYTPVSKKLLCFRVVTYYRR